MQTARVSVHSPKLEAIFQIFSPRRLLSELSFRFSLAAGVSAAGAAWVSGDSLKAVGILSNYIISMVPAILGVVIAGYSIAISREPGRDAEQVPGKSYSWYQAVNAKFLLAIVVLCTGLMIGLTIGFGRELFAGKPVSLTLATFVNTTLVALLGFFCSYTLCVCLSTAKTMFSMGQILNVRAMVKANLATKEVREDENASGSRL